MRWIVVSLLLINAVLAGWYWSQSSGFSPSPTDARLPTTSMNNLRLEETPETSTEPTPPAFEPGPELAQCDFLGRFSSPALAEDARSRLDALEVEADVEAVEVPDEPLWWVHLPPERTRGEAERRLRTLSERQIESFLVTQGEYRNAISLGYFRSRDNALRLRSRLESEGVAAELREMQRFRQEYWLIVPPEQSGILSDSSIRPIRDQVPDVSLRQEACDWLQNS